MQLIYFFCQIGLDDRKKTYYLIRTEYLIMVKT